MKLLYYDLHTHILPGVDDGAVSLEETKKMLYQEVNEGVHTIIATPHYRSGKTQDIVRLREKVKEVQNVASEISKELKILLGNELFYSESIVDDLKQGKALTLNNTRYVLVEFRITEPYDGIFKGLGNIIRAGYIPILAHVERYQCLRKNEEHIMELIELGGYIQMNSRSLLGGIFNMEVKYNKSLLKNGLVHFISSDCHDGKLRTPMLHSVLENIKKQVNPQLLENVLIHNPRFLLENKYI